MIAVDTMLFCSGHAFMPDGRLLISGGHKADGEGIDITTIFDPSGETFIQNLPKMAFGRWYPDGHRAARRPHAHDGGAGLRRRAW